MRRIKTPDVHLHFGLGLEAVNCRRLGETFEEDFQHRGGLRRLDCNDFRILENGMNFCNFVKGTGQADFTNVLNSMLFLLLKLESFLFVFFVFGKQQ